MEARARARWAASTIGAFVLALAIVGSATSGAGSSLAAPNAVLDQSNPARPSACRFVGWAPDSANEWVAETFTAGLSGSLTDVVLWLAVSNPQNPVAIVRVDAAGRPDVNATLASTVLAVDGSTTFKAVGVAFPAPARVEAGRQYAVVLYAPAAGAWGWQADLGSSLPDPDGKPCGNGANVGGRIWLSSDSSFGSDGDFFFQTYVVPARHVTVQKTGSGTGVVKDGTGAIDCGSTCSGEFSQGQTVTLTAAADAGSTFSGWTGGCTGAAPACSTQVSGDVSVTATFAKTLVALRVSKVGRGAVTSAPAGLVCGRACSHAFAPGPVKLTAKPAKGWRFARWKGACRGTKPVCRLALASTTGATALFAKV